MRTENGQFQKGHSGNPAGRPPGPSLSSRIRDALDAPDPADPQRTRADAMIAAAIERACAGSFQHFHAILLQLDGRPVAQAEDDKIDQFTNLLDLLSAGAEEDGRLKDAEMENACHADSVERESVPLNA